jgi:hypothetical protein
MEQARGANFSLGKEVPDSAIGGAMGSNHSQPSATGVLKSASKRFAEQSVFPTSDRLDRWTTAGKVFL